MNQVWRWRSGPQAGEPGHGRECKGALGAQSLSLEKSLCGDQVSPLSHTVDPSMSIDFILHQLRS